MTERRALRGRALPQRLRAYTTRFGSRATVRDDLKAGVVLGGVAVPDGLAAGLLAGVNPVHGVQAYLAGMLGGALASGSILMTVQTTGAMAVIVSDVPATQDPATSAAALTTLSLLTGVVMLALGLARLGTLVRFVPTAVLAGFTTAVAVNIVLAQFSHVTGYVSAEEQRLLRAVDTVLHPAGFDVPTMLVAVVTAVLVVALSRTRLGPLGMVVAVAVASLLAALVPGLDVVQVGDTAQIGGAAFTPAAPQLNLLLPLVVPALSLVLVGLVQGAAIGASSPNPDGRHADPSTDFRGQGVANLVAVLAQGMPVGGSMSGTALARRAGARTATAIVVAVVTMLVVVLLCGDLVEAIAMPALGALLMVVGVSSIKPAQVTLVWRTGAVQASVLAVTFLLTLVLPMQYAVLVGVGMAVILHVTRQANRIRLVAWHFDEGQRLPRESAPPAVLTPGYTIVLVPYGSLFFAAATKLEEQLPRVPMRAEGCHVVLRLRGVDDLGATMIVVLTTYAERLAAVGATFALAGVSAELHRQLRTTGALDVLGAENVFLSSDLLGASLDTALTALRQRGPSA